MPARGKRQAAGRGAALSHQALGTVLTRLSIQINFLKWWTDRSVFGFLEGLFEASLQQFGFDFFLFGALFEEAFAALGFLFEELGGMIQIGSFGGFWGWLVEENLAKLCIHFKPRPAVWTY